MIFPRQLAARAVALFVACCLIATSSCHHWKPVPLTAVEADARHRPTMRFTLDGHPDVEGEVVGIVDRTVYVAVGKGQRVAVDLDKVRSAEVRRLNVASTVIVSVFGTALAVLIVVLLTKTSCPFVYAETETGWVFVGEAYSGAAFRSVAREDLLPLPFLKQGRARIRIANEADETQHTDLAQLMAVDVPEGSRAVADHEQRVRLVGPAVPARAVHDLAGKDVALLVARAGDADVWQSDLSAEARASKPNLVEGIVIDFDATAGARAVLELEIGNTMWGDAVFGRFFALMGDKLGDYLAAGNAPQSGPRIEGWRRREGVVATLERWAGGVWQPLAFVPTVGPASMRGVAVPLPEGLTGPQRVRLRGGLGFWRIGGVSVSTLREAEPARTLVPASTATRAGLDQRALVAAADGQDDAMANRDDVLGLTFDTPPAVPGVRRQFFLRTHGWYNVHRPPQSEQSRMMLRTIRDEPGSLARFGLDLYRAMLARATAGVARP